MRCLRSLCLLLLCAGFSVVAVPAQSPANLPRINGPVDSGKLIELRGNVPFLAKAQFDKGEAPASQQLGRMRLVLTRSVSQEAALDTYLGQLQDKSSPNYHKWLTPEQYGKLYGPADSDLAAIVAWLQSRGLTVDTISPARTTIAFTGTVRQVEDAFHTSIHTFEAAGQQFTANTVNPRIPSALTAVVSGVAGLSTYRPRPHSVMSKQGYFDPTTGRLTPVARQDTHAPKADLTLGSATAGYSLYIVPGDAATMYDTPNSTFNANYSTGTNYTGNGVTIGIGGASTIQGSTVASYRTRFLGNSTAPTITYCSSSVPITCSTDPTSAGVTANGAIDEAYLDNELSGGLAPGASLHYYASNDLWSGVEQAISDNTVDIFSLSFGECELFMDTADNSFINSVWQEAAAQGITVTVSTGDSGSAVCDDPNSETVAQYGLQVSGFASTPYNIAVGGTDLSGLLTSFSTYVGTTSTAAGTSANYYRSALKYIPEATWNDSVLMDGTIANNQEYTYKDSKGNPVSQIWSGSGGASSCSTNTTTYNSDGTETLGNCTSGYTKPVWQRGSGVPADGVRDLPDVSLMAGAGTDSAAWLVCTDDVTSNSSGTNVTTNCTQQSDGYFYFYAFGGTSTATPAFAGILALVQQSAGGGRLGQAAKELYDLYNGSQAGSIFHDITTGNNSVPCTTGTPNCAKNSQSQYFESGYNTNAGYDLATGMGSVDVVNLVKYWGTGTGATAATITVTPTPATLTTLQSLSVKVSLTGTVGTPGGTVTLSSGAYTSSAGTLASGSYTFSIPAGSLTTGNDTLSVAYSGDVNYSSGTQTTVVTVMGLTATLTAVANPTSIDSGQSLSVAVAVSGSDGSPTGSVSLSGGGYTSSSQPLTSGAASITVPANKLSAGTDTLTVTYSGDTIYNSASGSTTVTVTASDYTLSASTPAAISPGGSATSTITVATTTNYSGTVTLKCSLTSSPTGATDVPTCSAPSTGIALNSTTASATGNITVNTTAATAQLKRPFGSWMGAGGGAVFALVVFLGVPARRRSWRAMLGVLILLMTLGSLSACGSGGGGGGGGNSNPGTTAGTYTFTVTGTGSPALSSAPTTTFTLTVN